MLEFIRKLIRSVFPKPKPKPRADKRVWDKREHNSWGDKIAVMDCEASYNDDKSIVMDCKASVYGCTTPRPKAGDDMLIPIRVGLGETKIGCFELMSVDYCSDPPDMWFAEAKLKEPVG